VNNICPSTRIIIDFYTLRNGNLAMMQYNMFKFKWHTNILLSYRCYIITYFTNNIHEIWYNEFAINKVHFPGTPTFEFWHQTRSFRLFFVCSRLFRKPHRLFYHCSRIIPDLRWECWGNASTPLSNFGTKPGASIGLRLFSFVPKTWSFWRQDVEINTMEMNTYIIF